MIVFHETLPISKHSRRLLELRYLTLSAHYHSRSLGEHLLQTFASILRLRLPVEDTVEQLRVFDSRRILLIVVVQFLSCASSIVLSKTSVSSESLSTAEMSSGVMFSQPVGR